MKKPKKKSNGFMKGTKAKDEFPGKKKDPPFKGKKKGKVKK